MEKLASSSSALARSPACFSVQGQRGILVTITGVFLLGGANLPVVVHVLFGSVVAQSSFWQNASMAVARAEVAVGLGVANVTVSSDTGASVVSVGTWV